MGIRILTTTTSMGIVSREVGSGQFSRAEYEAGHEATAVYPLNVASRPKPKYKRVPVWNVAPCGELMNGCSRAARYNRLPTIQEGPEPTTRAWRQSSSGPLTETRRAGLPAPRVGVFTERSVDEPGL